MTDNRKDTFGFSTARLQPKAALRHDDPFRLPELKPDAVARSFMEVVKEKKQAAKNRAGSVGPGGKKF